MSFAETVALGALAGFTIFLGLPAGRLQLLSARLRVGLAMFSVGVLAFVFVDVVAHAMGIVEGALDAFKNDGGGFGRVAWLAILLAGGFTIGAAGLGLLERRLRPVNRPLPPLAGGSAEAVVPPADLQAITEHHGAEQRYALRTGMTIAAAIGLHNFAEGLAIGVSARSGAISLATVLIIGFALHNATEGFGIVGPLGGIVPSWRWLGVAGLVGGAPTFIGAMVGYEVTSDALELVFYGVAGGAILYVIGEIWQGMRRYGHRELGMLLLSAGFVVAVLTDLVVAYGGG
jgi:ZIP family zinc transporter